VALEDRQIRTGRRVLQTLERCFARRLTADIDQMLLVDKAVDQDTKGWFYFCIRMPALRIDFDEQPFDRLARMSFRGIVCRAERQLLLASRATTVFPVTEFPRRRSFLALDFPETTVLVAFPRELQRRPSFLSYAA
jgi:hypothetical protein